MNRRNVLAGAGMLALAPALTGCAAKPEVRRLEQFGLQLSTITPRLVADFPGALEEVAEIGYKQVEFSAFGFLDRSAEEVEALLAENGLIAPVGRVSPKLPANAFSLPRGQLIRIFRERGGIDHMLDNVRAGIPAAKRLGQRDLVLPAITPDRFQSLAQVRANIELLREAAEICAAEGLRFGYHNHDWELRPVEGVVPYDLMIEETDPDKMTFQLDAYWIVKGGGNLQDYLSRYPGRFSSCHMKDIDTNGDFADVGDGTIDFPTFTRSAIAAGAEHFFVERDQPPQPMQSARRSFAYLSQMTF